MSALPMRRLENCCEYFLRPFTSLFYIVLKCTLFETTFFSKKLQKNSHYRELNLHNGYIYLLFNYHFKQKRNLKVSSNYRFAFFKSNIPFITNNKNATTTAYASRVTDKNNTRTIPSIMDIPVMAG